jgi:hypothetical protein
MTRRSATAEPGEQGLAYGTLEDHAVHKGAGALVRRVVHGGGGVIEEPQRRAPPGSGRVLRSEADAPLAYGPGRAKPVRPPTRSRAPRLPGRRTEPPQAPWPTHRHLLRRGRFALSLFRALPRTTTTGQYARAVVERLTAPSSTLGRPSASDTRPRESARTAAWVDGGDIRPRFGFPDQPTLAGAPRRLHLDQAVADSCQEDDHGVSGPTGA